MYATMNNLADWILRELKKREWSQSDLARRAGVSRSAISDIITGKRNIGRDLAISIASAFNVPLDEVFRASGLLPPAETSARFRQVDHLLSQLEDDEQEGVVEFIKMRLKLAGKNEKKKTAASSRSTK